MNLRKNPVLAITVAITAAFATACASTGPSVPAEQLSATADVKEKCRLASLGKKGADGDTGEGVVAPRKLSSDRPEMPPQRIRSAAACVSARVGVDGRLKDPVLVHSTDEVYARRVLESLDSWLFEPATLDGEPVEVDYFLRFDLLRQ
ncbi:MAG: hypothetical protein AAGF23_25460 [Acidobacteriota bacterium]